jgi:hypothetical protein
MKCAICGITVETIDEAVEEGWTPYFYDGAGEHEFACPGCAETFLQEGEDGEMEVMEDYRGKLRYLAEIEEKAWQYHSEVVATVLEYEPGKLK